MALYSYPSSSRQPQSSHRTEFDVLRESHKFLRPEDEKEQELSWEDQMAKKYYSSLFREFAVCDLKHYKSGNFALRWRTEAEVLAGAGEETCGNTRCTHHEPSRALRPPALTTLELPFAYEEKGERRSALVKVVLCNKCIKKLMWKRNKEKELAASKGIETEPPSAVVKIKDVAPSLGDARVRRATDDGEIEGEGRRRKRKSRGQELEVLHRRRNSRSRSPINRDHTHLPSQRDTENMQNTNSSHNPQHH